MSRLFTASSPLSLFLLLFFPTHFFLLALILLPLLIVFFLAVLLLPLFLLLSPPPLTPSPHTIPLLFPLLPLLLFLLQLRQSEKLTVELQRPSSSSHFRTIERQDSFDVEGEPVIRCGRVGRVNVVRPHARTRSLDLASISMETTPPTLKKNPHIAQSDNNEVFQSCMAPLDFSHSRGSAALSNGVNFLACDEDMLSVGSDALDYKNLDVQTASSSLRELEPRPETEPANRTKPPRESSPSTEPNQGGSGVDPLTEGREEEGKNKEAAGSSGRVEEVGAGDGGENSSEMSSRAEKEKGDLSL